MSLLIDSMEMPKACADGGACYRRGWNDAIKTITESAETIINDCSRRMMYDNLSSRLRGKAEVSDTSPYIKELMREVADSLDHFFAVIQKLSNQAEPFNNISKPFNSEDDGEKNGWHEFEPGKYMYDEMEANP